MVMFEPFPRLDEHLRFMIWEAACFVNPRSFEISTPPKDNRGHRLGPHDHSSLRAPRLPRGLRALGTSWFLHRKDGFAVSEKSDFSTPSILQASKEARKEAKRYYIYIKVRTTKLELKMIWLNPLLDVLYLGDNACMGTMIALLESDIRVTRVAIVSGERDPEKCNKCKLALVKYPSLEPFLGAHVGHVTRMLRILHGFAPEEVNDVGDKFIGCGGLKDVFLFMKEDGPFDQPTTSFGGCVQFKEYTKENPYFPRLGAYRVSSDDYLKRLMDSAMAPIEENRWAGVKHPKIQLARPIQPLPSGEVFEMIALRIPGRGEHRMIWWFTRNPNNKPPATLWPPEYRGPGDYILKLMGSTKAVERAKKGMAAEIERSEAIFKTKISIIDVGEAAFPTSQFMTPTLTTDHVSA